MIAFVSFFPPLNFVNHIVYAYMISLALVLFLLEFLCRTSYIGMHLMAGIEVVSAFFLGLGCFGKQARGYLLSVLYSLEMSQNLLWCMNYNNCSLFYRVFAL